MGDFCEKEDIEHHLTKTDKGVSKYRTYDQFVALTFGQQVRKSRKNQKPFQEYGKGFEKINDLEVAIQNIRKDLGNQILKREL